MSPNRLPRMAEWLLAALLLTIVIAFTSPQQLPVVLYKLALISLAAVVAYWLDRSFFPYARPDSYLNTDDWARSWRVSGKRLMDADFPVAKEYHLIFAAAMLRRAIIVGAVVVGVALGL